MELIKLTPVESSQLIPAFLLCVSAVAVLYFCRRIVKISSFDTLGKKRFLCLGFLIPKSRYLEVRISPRFYDKVYTNTLLVQIPEYEWGYNEDDVLMVCFGNEKVASTIEEEVLINLDF